MNINRFRSEGLVLGGARPSNFVITITFPDLVNVPNLPKKCQLLGRASKLPESIMGDVPVPYFGRNIKLAGNRQFGDWEVTFMNDEDFMIRNAFEMWHNGINTMISNRLDERVANISPALGDSYKTNAIVTQISKKGPADIDGDGAIKSYNFEGIFPTMVSEIPLDFDATNQFEQFQVRFAVDWYEPSTRANDQPIFPLELSDG